MPGEKRFRTSFLGGFRKSDVNAYIEKILKEFDDKLKEKDDEIAALKSQCKDFRVKYEDLFNKTEKINEDRSKIADVLIRAQENAQQLIDNAKLEALEEKKKLDDLLEQEREKLVDVRQEMKYLKSEVVNTLKKYENQLDDFVKDDEETG